MNALNVDPQFFDPRHVQVFVDSLALLSGMPAEECVFLYDDGVDSAGQGTSALASPVVAGQLVRWSLVPIDLQAPAWIAGIEFQADQAEDSADAVPDLPPAWARRWEGIVPAYATPGRPYAYDLLLTFADGKGDPVRISGPALRIAALPEFPAGAGDAGDVVTIPEAQLTPMRAAGDLI